MAKQAKSRDDYAKECPAYGWTEEGGTGFDASTEECTACLGQEPEMAAACKAEAEAGQKAADDAQEAALKAEKEEDAKTKAEAEARKAAEKKARKESAETTATEPPPTEDPKQTATVEKPPKPKPEKPAEAPKTLADWRKRFRVREGSAPCVVFDKIHAGGKTAAQIGQELATEQPKKFTVKTGTSWTNHLIEHWATKRGYVGIVKDADGILSVKG